MRQKLELPLLTFPLKRGGLYRVGFGQDALLADSGMFAATEWQYPVLRAGDKQGVLQVTPFLDAGTVLNYGESAILETNRLAI